jgi:hypothetical protein
LLPAGRYDDLVAAGPTGRLGNLGHQCVVDGAEQCGAGRGQGDEVVLARGSCCRLPSRLGDPGSKRRPRDGAGELGQAGSLGGLRTEQARDEDPVEAVDGRQGIVEPGDGSGEQIGAHHAVTLVGGNHCISGKGAVVGASSR